MNIKILAERRRLIIQVGGWSLIDLDLMTRIRPATPLAEVPGHDPRSTLAAQVEQADEPPAGFGFTGTVSHVVARKEP